MIVIACSVRQNGRVKDLAAAGAFPCVERSYVVIKLFVEHTTLAFWTFHINFPPEDHLTTDAYDIFSLCAENTDYFSSSFNAAAELLDICRIFNMIQV
jgi:hypothetical protein